MYITEFIVTIFCTIVVTYLVTKHFVLKKVNDDKLSLIKSEESKVNLAFTEIYNNLDKSKFKARIGNIVYIYTNLKGHGDVELIYLLDKSDLCIFKENECIYTSNLLSDQLRNKIKNAILDIYANDINDVVEFLGTLYSKDYHIMITNQLNIGNSNDITEIKNINELKYDLDEILDKISKNGIGSLTKDEKDFLDNTSKK